MNYSPMLKATEKPERYKASVNSPVMLQTMQPRKRKGNVSKTPMVPVRCQVLRFPYLLQKQIQIHMYRQTISVEVLNVFRVTHLMQSQ